MAPYCIEHGGYVISTAIDRHVYITLKPREDKRVRVFSMNSNAEFLFDIGDKDYSTKFELFKGIFNVLNIKDGFEITTYSELPAGSGMGGSSSLSVALIGALDKYYNLKLSKYEIAQSACEVERVELKQKGGFQDQFAASYGGFNFIEFTDKVKVVPIRTSEEFINELHFRLILCYVGGYHFSPDIQDEVLNVYVFEKKSLTKRIRKIPKDVLKHYEIWKRIVEFGGPEGLKKIKGFLTQDRGPWNCYDNCCNYYRWSYRRDAGSETRLRITRHK